MTMRQRGNLISQSESAMVLSHHLHVLRLIFLLFILLATPTQSSTTTTLSLAYGTYDGYDSGGDASVCWESKILPAFRSSIFFETTSTEAEQSEELNTRFLEWNKLLYGGSTDTKSDQLVQILRQCPGMFNVSLSLTSPFVPNAAISETLYAKIPYNYQLEVQVCLPAIAHDTTFFKNTSVAWIRLVLCKSHVVGFCHPMVGSSISQNNEIVEMSANFTSIDNKNATEGLRILSRFVRMPLFEGNSGCFANVADLELTVYEPDSYFVIGHSAVLLDVLNESAPFVTRLDAAGALPQRSVRVIDAPVIMKNSFQFKLALGIVSGIFAGIFLAMLVFILWNRKHQVMQLAQFKFLAVFVGCAVVAAASMFTYLPLYDVFCRLEGPLVIFPLTLMSSISIGRLWRVYTTLSVAMSIGRSKRSAIGHLEGNFNGMRTMAFLGALASIHHFFQGKMPTSRRYSLRNTVSEGDLVRLITMLSLPQAIFLAYGASHSPPRVVQELTQWGLIGRLTCDNGTDWEATASTVYMILLFLLGAYVAWVARDLPSVFNEKAAIFNTMAINAILYFLIMVMQFLTDSPTTSPDVKSALDVIKSLGVACSFIFMIVVPKIERVRSGDKIVISNLLDHAAERRDTQNTQENDTVVTNAASLIINSESDSSPESRRIVVKKHEPPPHKVETLMLDTKSILERLIATSLEGRQISLDEWEKMIQLVDNLNDNLQTLEFSWTREDENDEPHRNE